MTFSDSYLSARHYSTLVADASLLLVPLRQVVRFGGFTEYYGSTKISGAVADAVRYGQRIALPRFYRDDPSLDDTRLDFTDYDHFCQVMEQAFVSPDPVSRVHFQPDQVAQHLLLQLTVS